MLKILIGGGFDDEAEAGSAVAREFAGHLGREVIKQGHIVLGACRTELDQVVAENAARMLEELELAPADRIVSYVCAGEDPVHNFGNVLESQLSDWELGSPKLRVPEPIQLADVVVLVGGFQGTHRAANWTRIADKPLLAVKRFGGAAADIYVEELEEFERKYGARLDRGDYENLAQIGSPPSEFAEKVINLAEKVRASNSVFVIMSFSDDPALEDVLASYKEVCDEFGYDCRRIDEEADVPRILPEIMNRIVGCAFAVVDLSDEKANVYYELGFAEGCGKPRIVTAKKGTQLPFDVADIPVIFWENMVGLKKDLRQRMQVIAATQGRRVQDLEP